MAADLTLHSLPLFPLGTVLFPGGLLPLRIFEVRYLDMIGRCHKAGAPFGVVSLTQGHEVKQPGAPSEAFAQVGTLARISDFAAPQPGLMMIRIEGLHRFRITRSQQLKHGLWVADIAALEPDVAVPVPPDLEASAQSLSRLLASLQEKLAPGEAMPVAEPWHLDDCGWVANRWCELLPVPVTLKQRLMELDNPLVRLELVGDLLTRMGIG
ncbi:LON peptidase substrate-binding domain-containing protein [Ramlibacter rhizophilus]|uniref:Peptidase S16 n=1 Tax=Ramlibacter rhizophilus TaxID=1781167 RepID=A0A4Z0BCR9_9BURK|nr:LON peptidase substrate-binding domain-containing protein [Ramlibacter rhizophilus]TFY96491.1 peptidase S16 [Ramlibacter rhizophilus]